MSSSIQSRYAHHAMAFGCLWASDLPLDAFHPVETAVRVPDITVMRCFDAGPERLNPQKPKLARVVQDGLRLLVDDVLTADSFGANRVEVRTGPKWTGEFPAGFFGTLTGAVLAWRGLLPMHGSAVMVDGKAVLVCGSSGAGKSTMTAALVAAGARFLSDDLTVLHPQPEKALPQVFAGRRSVRLYPVTAEWLANKASCEVSTVLEDGKQLVTPEAGDAAVGYPLAAIVVLGEVAGEDKNVLLEHFYRPRITEMLPWQFVREAQAREAARRVPVLRMPGVEARDAKALDAMRERVERVVDALR